MRRVRVARLRHGEGVLVYPNTAAYKGSCREHAEGRGVMYAPSGKYEGAFHAANSGVGSYLYANGEMHTGKRMCPEKYDPPKLLADEYRTGTLHDYHCEVRFSDGSLYTGQMIDGNISGEGKWHNPATGESKEGIFKNGLLHGRGKLVTAKREVFEGEFYEGELHGMGRFKDKNGDIFEGEYHHGQKTGRGKMVYANGNVYEGYYRDDWRHGHGTMTYGNVNHKWDPKMSKTFLIYDHRYEGDWAVGNIRARGSHTSIVPARPSERIHPTTTRLIIAVRRFRIYFRWRKRRSGAPDENGECIGV